MSDPFDAAWDSAPQVDAFDAAWGGSSSAPTATVGLSDRLMGGITSAPQSLLSSVQAIPSGLSNLLNTVLNPIDSVSNGTAETTVRGVGGIASGIAGAGAGAIAGAPLAPFTFGASVPIGMALGGAAGMLGFNKLNQATGSDAPTTAEEDLGNLAELTGQGIGGTALLKGAGMATKGAGAVVGKIADKLDDGATGFREKLLGVQYGDKKGSLGKNAVYLDDQGQVVPRDQALDTSSSLQERMITLDESGFFSRAPNDPSKAMAQLSSENALTQKAIGDLITKADQVVGNRNVLPNWDRAQKYVDRARASERPALQAELDKVKADYAADPGTGLQKIIRLKTQVGEDAAFSQKPSPKKAELLQQAYHDLQFLGEEVFDMAMPAEAGAFRNANQLAASQATFLKTMPASVAKARPGIIETLFTPTGSGAIAGTSGATAALLGNAAIPVAAGVGWLGRAIYKGVTNKAPISVSNALSKAAGGTESISSLLAKVAPIAYEAAPAAGLGAQLSAVLSGSKNERTKEQLKEGRFVEPAATPTLLEREGDPLSSRKEIEATSLLNPALNQNPTQALLKTVLQLPESTSESDMKLPKKFTDRLTKAGLNPDDLDAIDLAQIKAESSGVHTIEGPKTKYGTAKGLMQLLDGTGKEWHKKLGLEGKYDPFNAEQNLAIGKAYRNYLEDRYDGDTRLALAAYNWGLGNLDKALAKTKSGSFEEVYTLMPSETRKYVDKIMRDVNGGLVTA